MFTLDSRLKKDAWVVGRCSLSLVLLSKDANYPWCILVPRREAIREIHQLKEEDRLRLLVESCVLAEVMEKIFTPIKMNVAALGNMVPQLHLHHIARYEDDAAWPGPVWGKVEAIEYKKKQLQQRLLQLREVLSASSLEFVADSAN